MMETSILCSQLYFQTFCVIFNEFDKLQTLKISLGGGWGVLFFEEDFM